ncbi:hypothetical protein V6N13_111563 [Hibiscus sabdariffa]
MIRFHRMPLYLLSRLSPSTGQNVRVTSAQHLTSPGEIKIITHHDDFVGVAFIDIMTNLGAAIRYAFVYDPKDTMEWMLLHPTFDFVLSASKQIDGISFQIKQLEKLMVENVEGAASGAGDGDGGAGPAGGVNKTKTTSGKDGPTLGDIRDPEHPYSLEQLSVLSEESITVDEKLGRILITFTPTIQHCSMATVIGLCLRVKLKECFPPHFKVDIKVAPGSHADEESVNKLLNDKERVAAALENPNLRQLVDECLYSNEL